MTGPAISNGSPFRRMVTVYLIDADRSMRSPRAASAVRTVRSNARAYLFHRRADESGAGWTAWGAHGLADERAVVGRPSRQSSDAPASRVRAAAPRLCAERRVGAQAPHRQPQRVVLVDDVDCDGTGRGRVIPRADASTRSPRSRVERRDIRQVREVDDDRRLVRRQGRAARVRTLHAPSATAG